MENRTPRSKVKMKTKIIAGVVLLTLWSSYSSESVYCQDALSFSDDVENGLGQWEVFAKTTMEPLSDGARLVDSGDKRHGLVLSLAPGGHDQQVWLVGF